MSLLVRFGWTLWALVPVAIIAFHFGPGQELAAREAAVRRFNAAAALERVAIDAQANAYRAHLEAIEARRLDLLESPMPLEPVESVEGEEPVEAEPSERLARALSREREAYDRAAEDWSLAADAYEQVEEELGDSDPVDLARIRWSKARARVRSGAIWDGAVDLEEIVMTMSDDPQQVDLARAAREELAVAHYFGARLLRLAGEPAKTWRAEALKARQHFRFLAETAADAGASPELVRGLEDNVERTIELEQMDKSDLEGRPLPRESPRGTRGRRPGQGRPGVSQRPPTRRDGRGAGGAGPVGPGW